MTIIIMTIIMTIIIIIITIILLLLTVHIDSMNHIATSNRNGHTDMITVQLLRSQLHLMKIAHHILHRNLSTNRRAHITHRTLQVLLLEVGVGQGLALREHRVLLINDIHNLSSETVITVLREHGNEGVQDDVCLGHILRCTLNEDVLSVLINLAVPIP